MNNAYLVANVNVTDPKQYDQYRELSSRAIQENGVEVLVRGGTTEALEGQAPSRTVIMKFPDMAAARAFYESETYRQARKAREGAAEMTMYIVEGMGS